MIKITPVLCVLFSFFAFSQTTVNVRVATGEYPPFTGQNLIDDGFINHVIRLILNNQGYHTEFVYLPWKRSFQSAKRGEFDLASYWVCEEAYLKDFYCSEQIYQGKLLLYFRKNTQLPKWTTIQDLKDYRISATLGYEYVPEFHKLVKEGELDVLMVNNDKHSLKMLLNNRVDMVLLSETAMQALLKKHFTPADANQIHASSKPLITYTAHVLFPKTLSGSEALKNRFNEGLLELKQSGELDNQWQRMINDEFRDKQSLQ